MLNHVKLRSQLNVEVFFGVFWEPFGPDAPKMRSFWSLLGTLWEPSGHLWENFGHQGAPKAPKSDQKKSQRFQGSQRRLRKDEMPRLSRQV